MKIKVAQVVGLNTDQKAAQVVLESRGEGVYFFAVLILSCDDAFTKGRQALSEISDFYFELDTGTPAEKLTATFEEAKKKLGAEGFSVLLASVSGKVLYIQSVGDVTVFLKRGEKISPLNSNTSGQLISGFLQENDRLLFATASLITFLGDDLSDSLQLDIDAFEEEIADRIGATTVEDQSLAGLLAEINMEEVEEVKVQNTNSEQDIEVKQEAIEKEDISNLQQEDKVEDVVEPIYYNSDSSKFNFLKSLTRAIKPAFMFIWEKRKHFPKSNRGRLIIAVILLVVIAIGVGFQINVKKEAKLQAEFNQVLQKAKDDLQSAKGLSTLNAVEAKNKLDQAKSGAEKAISLKPKNSEAQALKKQIEDDSSSILQQFEVSQFPLFLDLDLVKKNFRPTNVSLSNGSVLLLDTVLKTLVSIDLKKKSNQILAGEEQLGDAKYASLNGDLAFIYSKDKGVLKLDINSKKVSVVSKIDKEWGEISDIYGFGGNVYLLDKGLKEGSARNASQSASVAGGQIWKYLPTSSGYSDKREYLSKGVKGDFANSIRMQIESSVYVLKSGGEMNRFTKGGKDNFSYEGLPDSIKDPKSFFVSSDTENLYLLDSGNSRLLILSKTGGYKSQISGEKFGSVTDLVVDEQDKKIYLLDGSKIYFVDLK